MPPSAPPPIPHSPAVSRRAAPHRRGHSAQCSLRRRQSCPHSRFFTHPRKTPLPHAQPKNKPPRAVDNIHCTVFLHGCRKCGRSPLKHGTENPRTAAPWATTSTCVQCSPPDTIRSSKRRGSGAPAPHKSRPPLAAHNVRVRKQRPCGLLLFRKIAQPHALCRAESQFHKPHLSAQRYSFPAGSVPPFPWPAAKGEEKAASKGTLSSAAPAARALHRPSSLNGTSVRP